MELWMIGTYSVADETEETEETGDLFALLSNAESFRKTFRIRERKPSVRKT